MKSTIKKALFLVSLGAAIWFALGIYKRHRELSQRPLKVNPAQIKYEAQESSIQTDITIPYGMLADVLNAQAPISYPFSGREHVTVDVTTKIEKEIREKIGGDVGKVIGAVTKWATKIVTVDQVDKIGGDVDYNAVIKRDGPLQVGLNGSSMRISAPLSFAGQAGINGDVAKVLKLDKKNFNGAMRAWSDCTFGLNPDWSPRISATPDFEWERARVEIAHNVWISVKSATQEPLKAAMQKIPDTLIRGLGNNVIRDAVRPWWKMYTVPIRLRETETYLHIAPKTVGLSSIGYVPEGVRFSLMLIVTSQGSTNKTSPLEVPPLPDLTPLSSGANIIRLKLPLQLDYDSFSKAASREIEKQTFNAKTSAGPLQIHLKNVEAFPTDENRVAIGCTAEIVFPENAKLSTSGKFFLIAETHLDAEKQQLALQNVAFRRFTDNFLWDTVSAVFESQIKDAIEKAAKIELQPFLDEAISTLKKQAASPDMTRYGTVSLDKAKIHLDSVRLSGQAFELSVSCDAEFLLALKRPEK